MERANRTIYDRIRHCEVMTIQEIAFINNGQNQTFYNNLRSLCKRDRSFFFFSWKKEDISALILDLGDFIKFLYISLDRELFLTNS